MTRTMPAPRVRALRPLVAVMLIAVVLIAAALPAAALAQDGDFEASVAEARAATQAVLDEANLASEEGLTSMSVEQHLMGPVAEHVPRLAAELRAYAETLASLDAPADRAADVEAHVAALREVAAAYDGIATAAARGDDATVTDGYEAVGETLARLAASLDPAYFDLAFVSPFRDSFDSFKGATEEELAYLDGVRDAMMEFQRRNADAFRAIGGTYPSPEAMMRALHEAGAGEAFAAVEAKAQALTPPERFADEHAWWLENLAESARLDGLIGEAARDGDPAEFMAINNRLANVSDRIDNPVYPELDPAFGTAAAPFSPLGARLDPASAIGRDPYGVALFDLLRDHAWTDPVINAVVTFDFPGVTLPLQMEALARTADELEANWAAFETAIAELEPSEPFAEDHARILAFVDEHGVQFRELLAAAKAGDDGAIQPARQALRLSYCEAAASLSDAIGPAASVWLDPTFDICR